MSECFVFTFRVKTKTRYEMGVKTFDKLYVVGRRLAGRYFVYT